MEGEKQDFNSSLLRFLKSILGYWEWFRRSLARLRVKYNILHDILLVIFAVVSVTNFVVSTYLPDSEPIIVIDYIVSAFFLAELAVNIVIARSILGYIFSYVGLIDMLAAIPAIKTFITDAGSTLGFSRVFVVFRLHRSTLYLFDWSQRSPAIVKEGFAVVLSIFAFIFFCAGLVFDIDLLTNGESFVAAYGDAYGEPLKFDQAFYYIVVTLSTVGYGDIVPVTTGARMMVVCIILAAVVYIPWRTGGLINTISKYSAYSSRFTEPPFSKNNRHVIVTGRFTATDLELFLVDLLLPDPLLQVVVLHPGFPEPDVEMLIVRPEFTSRVTYLEGDATNQEDLLRANIKKAKAVFLLVHDVTGDPLDQDAMVVLQAVAIRQASTVPMFAQVLHPDSKDLMNKIGVEYVMSLNDLKMRLLAHSCKMPGFCNLFCSLFFGHKRSLYASSATATLSTVDFTVANNQPKKDAPTPPNNPSLARGNSLRWPHMVPASTQNLISRERSAETSAEPAGGDPSAALPETNKHAKDNDDDNLVVTVTAGKSQRLVYAAVPTEATPPTPQHPDIKYSFSKKLRLTFGLPAEDPVEDMWKVEYDYGLAYRTFVVLLPAVFEGSPIGDVIVELYDTLSVLLIGTEGNDQLILNPHRDLKIKPKQRALILAQRYKDAMAVSLLDAQWLEHAGTEAKKARVKNKHPLSRSNHKQQHRLTTMASRLSHSARSQRRSGDVGMPSLGRSVDSIDPGWNVPGSSLQTIQSGLPLSVLRSGLRGRSAPLPSSQSIQAPYPNTESTSLEKVVWHIMGEKQRHASTQDVNTPSPAPTSDPNQNTQKTHFQLTTLTPSADLHPPTENGPTTTADRSPNLSSTADPQMHTENPLDGLNNPQHLPQQPPSPNLSIVAPQHSSHAPLIPIRPERRSNRLSRWKLPPAPGVGPDTQLLSAMLQPSSASHSHPVKVPQDSDEGDLLEPVPREGSLTPPRTVRRLGRPVSPSTASNSSGMSCASMGLRPPPRSLRDHIILCGSLQDVEVFIQSVRRVSNLDQSSPQPIVLVSSSDVNPLLASKISCRRNMFFVQASPLHRSALLRARIKEASRVVVLANRNASCGDPDAETVMIALQVRSLGGPEPLVELTEERHMRSLTIGETKPGEVDNDIRQSPAFAAGTVYSHSMLNTVLSEIWTQDTGFLIGQLLEILLGLRPNQYSTFVPDRNGNRETCPLSLEQVPTEFVGKPFKDLLEAFYFTRNALCLGLYRLRNVNTTSTTNQTLNTAEPTATGPKTAPTPRPSSRSGPKPGSDPPVSHYVYMVPHAKTVLHSSDQVFSLGEPRGDWASERFPDSTEAA